MGEGGPELVKQLLNKTYDCLLYTSDIADDNSTVKISLKYTVKNPFNILGKRQITIYEKRITDIWLGEEKDGFELNNNDESEYVYITQYGEVYHIEKMCSYLVRNIKAASLAEITDLRNASGGKYYQCSLCKGASVSYTHLIYLKVTAKEFIQPLYGNIAGIIIMTVCLAVYVVSDMWAKRIVNIEV